MQRITINTCENLVSEIYIKNDLKDELQSFFENKNYFLITNKTVAKLYPQIIYKFNTDKVIIIKDGEKYKNEKTFNKIISQLLLKKIERKDCIIALGGGVVGDLAGYVASSILRGVELIQIPTTLLAMCDSAIGGKTGYNTKFGKNLVGSFYPAKKIIIDPQFLNTLNDYEYKCGLGEILKYAFIEKSCKHDIEYNLLEMLEQLQKDDVKKEIEKIIAICVSLKANVVNKDIKEGGLRKVLNFGHTFAHPIETLMNYKKISHGQAVAHGMKMAAKLALSLNRIDENYFQKINYLIDKFELTGKIPEFDTKKFIEIMKQDKKVQNKKINLLLPVAPAVVELVDNIEEPSLEASLL